MKIKDCMQGTLIGKEESIDVWLCRECRSGAKKEPKDHKEAMEYASCVDTQSHFKKCKKCKQLNQEYKEKVKKMIEEMRLEHDVFYAKITASQALTKLSKKLEKL